MITTESYKNLKDAPKIFGIKASFMMYFILILILELLVTIVSMILFFIKKSIGGGFGSILIGCSIIIVTYLFFEYASKQKKFKKIKKRAEIISNINLNQFLK
ncbi:MAG: hypothetical protein LBQ13_04770 [Endomicrobium sp.]|jgi:ABC-type spermidine/putrescine transport system permease subunit II|nr:hypothetical protein [Endomicrobium sp.]